MAATEAKMEDGQKYVWIVDTWSSLDTWFQKATFDYDKPGGRHEKNGGRHQYLDDGQFASNPSGPEKRAFR